MAQKIEGLRVKAIIFMYYTLMIFQWKFRKNYSLLFRQPNTYKIFLSYTDGEKKAFIDWIYSAKKEKNKNRTYSNPENLKNEKYTDLIRMGRRYANL